MPIEFNATRRTQASSDEYRAMSERFDESPALLIDRSQAFQTLQENAIHRLGAVHQLMQTLSRVSEPLGSSHTQLDANDLSSVAESVKILSGDALDLMECAASAHDRECGP